MPTRGYRKGVSDEKQPLVRDLRARVTARTYDAFSALSLARGVTQARLLRAIVKAHVIGARAEIPQPRSFSADDMRELRRIGNNVNQIAHQANLMRLHLVEERALACLDALEGLARRLKT
ncbi:MAG: plasmid mobilization relaxosome protein MobC [Hyphomicrobiaceae bacterium]|nr:plasmid mobilization relaxosome protein MobC [Hyphomicrobiaceae bacterium]